MGGVAAGCEVRGWRSIAEDTPAVDSDAAAVGEDDPGIGNAASSASSWRRRSRIDAVSWACGFPNMEAVGATGADDDDAVTEASKVNLVAAAAAVGVV